MIRFILLQNRQGKTRLAKYYIPLEDSEKHKLEYEVHRLVVNRDPKFTNFVEVSLSMVDLHCDGSYQCDVIMGQEFDIYGQKFCLLTHSCMKILKGNSSEHAVAVLISISKKGDSTCTVNYRGISLINVALKIVTTIPVTRIALTLEMCGFFLKGQVGFRFREECIGQVACLKELVIRRKNVGKLTYVVFVDFRKAHDSVPHEALFYKLEAAGVGGKALRFVKVLYSHSQVCIRVGDRLSEPIKIERGVRQGCPGSPTLFNIFINDVINEAADFTVDIPGLTQKIQGLLFADDLVLLADSPLELQNALDRLSTWAHSWGMKFGISKCQAAVSFEDLADLKKNGSFTLGEERVEFRTHKVIYRRYAGLFFSMCVDITDNELVYLESIHLFVEILDHFFSNVCELDLVFNFHKVYLILDEFILAGELQETSKKAIIERMAELERQE
ncbi:hypothetical protein L7F22_039571 [Adiantum nelumboides]|nr:hypothetical protein [Adiantum nelumboides]